MPLPEVSPTFHLTGLAGWVADWEGAREIYPLRLIILTMIYCELLGAIKNNLLLL